MTLQEWHGTVGVVVGDWKTIDPWVTRKMPVGDGSWRDVPWRPDYTRARNVLHADWRLRVQPDTSCDTDSRMWVLLEEFPYHRSRTWPADTPADEVVRDMDEWITMILRRAS